MIEAGPRSDSGEEKTVKYTVLQDSRGDIEKQQNMRVTLDNARVRKLTGGAVPANESARVDHLERSRVVILILEIPVSSVNSVSDRPVGRTTSGPNGTVNPGAITLNPISGGHSLWSKTESLLLPRQGLSWCRLLGLRESGDVQPVGDC